MSDIPRQLRAQRQALIDRLRQQLPTLDARLRLRALETVADRVLSEVGPETGSVPLLLTALARAADGAVGGLSRLAEQTSTLLVAYRGAVTEAERREVLVRHLTATVHDPLRLAGDVRATRRYLDFEAVHDRLNSEAADRRHVVGRDESTGVRPVVSHELERIATLGTAPLARPHLQRHAVEASGGTAKPFIRSATGGRDERQGAGD